MDEIAIHLKNKLIELFAKCNDMEMVSSLFNSVSDDDKDAPFINVMMKALNHNKQYQYTLQLYEAFDVLTNDVSHVLAIKACINTNDFIKLNSIHKAMRYTDNVFIQTALIDAYGHFNDINSATHILDNIPESTRSAVHINSMMTALIHNGCSAKALEVFDEYSLADDTTYVLALKACKYSNNFEKGKRIHSQGVNGTIIFKNTLIDFYAHFGDMKNAQYIFDSIADSDRDIVSINVMMESYCNNYSEMHIQWCLDLFQRIMDKYDAVSYAIALKACTYGNLKSFGMMIHEKMKHDCEWMLNEMEIQINLINFYNKCGMMEVCQSIFDDIETSKHESIVTAMINVYGQNGELMKAKSLFDELSNKSTQSYMVMMNACSHCGDMESAIHIWKNEISEQHIKYNEKVITTLVDAYSRMGMIHNAYSLILDFESRDKQIQVCDEIMWSSLLSGCCKYGDTEMAQKVFFFSEWP